MAATWHCHLALSRAPPSQLSSSWLVLPAFGTFGPREREGESLPKPRLGSPCHLEGASSDLFSRPRTPPLCIPGN